MTQASLEPVPALSPAVLRSSLSTPVTLLRVFGEDAFSYLQSQVSADLRVSGERWVRYALWLDANGHVLADSFILREGAESFLLFSYSTPADKLEEIVLSNVIADDVEVEYLGERYQHWALWTAAGTSVAQPLPIRLPTGILPETGSFSTIEQQAAGSTIANVTANALLPVLLFAGRNATGDNYDLLIPDGVPLPPFAAALPQVPWAQRESRRIADGVPAVPADIGIGDLPQEGGDLARIAVSTSKGCYLGQEVIARWHATGQVRSALFRVRLIDSASSGAVTQTLLKDAAEGVPSLPDSASAVGICGALPARLYAGAKPVGELRSYAAQDGSGLALLRIHRLGDARSLGLEANGEAVFNVIEPMLS